MKIEDSELTMNLAEMLKLKEMHLAPYIQLATLLIGRPRQSGGNMFRHQIDTFGILVDYGYIDSVLLKASLVHDVIEDIQNIDRDIFLGIDDESLEVYKLVMEVTRRPIESKAEFLTRILNFGSEKSQILKCADRISNVISLGFVNNVDFVKRYIEETETLVLPIAIKVNKKMYDELAQLLQKRKFGV